MTPFFAVSDIWISKKMMDNHVLPRKLKGPGPIGGARCKAYCFPPRRGVVQPTCHALQLAGQVERLVWPKIVFLWQKQGRTILWQAKFSTSILSKVFACFHNQVAPEEARVHGHWAALQLCWALLVIWLGSIWKKTTENWIICETGYDLWIFMVQYLRYWLMMSRLDFSRRRKCCDLFLSDFRWEKRGAATDATCLSINGKQAIDSCIRIQILLLRTINISVEHNINTKLHCL